MNLNGVQGIPSGLLTCFINGDEVHIIELASEGFSFRVPEKIDEIQSVEFKIMVFDQSKYKSLPITDFKVADEVQESYFVTYTILTTQADYKNTTQQLIKNYTDYIYLKLSGDDAYLSEQLVNYPAELEEDFYQSFDIQKREWFSNLKEIDEESFYSIENSYELALNLDNFALYKQYINLKIVDFKTWLLKENNLDKHPMFQKQVNRLCIGNQFCHNLFPQPELLGKLLNKAHEESLEITVVFTYMRENLIQDTATILKQLNDWCTEHHKRIEVVINDWGMVSFIEENQFKWMDLSLGILLNKHRKDPRYSYKKGYLDIVDKLAENNLGYVDYCTFLEKEYHIKRFEYEAAGYMLKFPSKKNSLHIPYFQTNTSQFCTLYARCKNGSRGKQDFPQNCPRYCEESVFLYPKHLKMVGRYNSLFGMDDRVLADGAVLKEYLKQGIDRIVLSLW